VLCADQHRLRPGPDPALCGELSRLGWIIGSVHS